MRGRSGGGERGRGRGAEQLDQFVFFLSFGSFHFQNAFEFFLGAIWYEGEISFWTKKSFFERKPYCKMWMQKGCSEIVIN